MPALHTHRLPPWFSYSFWCSRDSFLLCSPQSCSELKWRPSGTIKRYSNIMNISMFMLIYWDNSQLSYSSFTYNILHLSNCNVSVSVCVWTFSGYWVSEERRSSLGSKVSLEVHPGGIWTFLHSGKNLFIISYEASREWLKISRSGLTIRVEWFAGGRQVDWVGLICIASWWASNRNLSQKEANKSAMQWWNRTAAHYS